MKGATLALFLLSLLAGCSIWEREPSLARVWQTVEAANVPTGTSGAVDDDHFYSMRGRANPSQDPRLMTAHDLETGERVWARPIEGPCDPPIVQGSRVFCPADLLYAFDAETGTPLWTYRPSETLQLVSGTSDPDRVYAGTLTSALAVDVATGTKLWQRSFDGPWSHIRMRSLTLATTGDLLIGFEGEFAQNQIFSVSVVIAVNPATGEERWRYVDGNETSNKGMSEIAVANDLAIYSSTTGREIVAFSLNTREVKWRSPFGPTAFSGTQAPAVVDGVVYYTDTTGGVYAVRAETGEEVWTTQRPAGFTGQDACSEIVFGSNAIGEFFERSSGDYLTDAVERDSDDVVGQAAASDGVFFVSANSGVYAYDCRL